MIIKIKKRESQRGAGIYYANARGGESMGKNDKLIRGKKEFLEWGKKIITSKTG